MMLTMMTVVLVLLMTYGGVGALLQAAPYDIIIPFLSEHISVSDQLLFVGASTDMPLQMLRAGYGGTKDNSQGFMTVIDSNESNIAELRAAALADPIIAPRMALGKCKFETVDLTAMPHICKQSVFDSIVDYGGLDSLLTSSRGKDGMLKCIDHLQDGVRLGNILVCLSKLDKATFCPPFEERFGWVQELDGDPGEISAWYRGKTNIAASKSEFSKYSLFLYAYTNTDNCVSSIYIES